MGNLRLGMLFMMRQESPTYNVSLCSIKWCMYSWYPKATMMVCQRVFNIFIFRAPRARKFVIDWANGEAHGSKKKRRFGYKPDAVVIRNGKQIGFLEVKPPSDSHTLKEYLHDHWNMANFCKDSTDDFFCNKGGPTLQ